MAGDCAIVTDVSAGISAEGNLAVVSDVDCSDLGGRFEVEVGGDRKMTCGRRPESVALWRCLESLTLSRVTKSQPHLVPLTCENIFASGHVLGHRVEQLRYHFVGLSASLLEYIETSCLSFGLWD